MSIQASLALGWQSLGADLSFFPYDHVGGPHLLRIHLSLALLDLAFLSAYLELDAHLDTIRVLNA